MGIRQQAQRSSPSTTPPAAICCWTSAIPTALQNGHLTLPTTVLQAGHNEVRLGFTANIGAAGKAITRYTDRDDKNEYLYTLFVPMDADMAFPCFDQPDLKARFSLQVEAPSDWTVVGNTAATDVKQNGEASLSTFPETHPISTYLFAFAAGPFARIAPAGTGQPALYVRKSQLTRAQTEAPAVQQITSRGITYLEDFFAQPFPFPKYDLVLIPGFPFGGMEHAGATFLNEDSVLFRTAPTQADYFRRDVLVLHETTHQWFGDLVTMRWFDDLWLKEGFAQYMAYKAQAALKPDTEPWKHFAEDIKPLAYGIDETEGTTPIFQQIPNLKDAKSAYGAIVYQKAPAILKQLEFRLGEENFRDGLRLYLRRHAYGNAQWADLIAAFEATGNQDVQAWANAWITHRGMPQVNVEWSCKGGRIASFTLSQHDVLKTDFVWPMDSQIILQQSYPYYLAGGHMDGDNVVPIILKKSWKEAQATVSGASGKPCPAFVFANYGDESYGRFLLDPVSLAAASSVQPSKDDQLLRTMTWSALWENVRLAGSSPRSFVETLLANNNNLPAEVDESLSRIQGARIATALHAYMGPKSRQATLPQAEAVIADRMLHAPTLGLRIVNFRTFTSIAETPAALAKLKALLAGTLTIPGMPLKPLDRWNVIGHLIALSDPEAAALFASEKENDKSGEGQKYAYAAEAGTPTAAAKQRYFADYLRDPSDKQARQEDWITQSLGSFNAWNQRSLTEPFLTPALNELPSIKSHRKIFFLGAWLNSFIGNQTTPEAQAAVHTWLLRKDIDPDLRLKVLEVSDSIDRTVLIRQRFPE
jgi:aminopeptidase N